MKIESKHILLGLGAIALIAFVWLMKTDESLFHNQHQEIKQLHDDKDSLYNIADSIIMDIQKKEAKYNHELDSLNKLAAGGKLTDKELKKLQKEIESVNELLEIEKKRKDTLIVRPTIIPNLRHKDSVIYHIINKDSVVYNIIEKDTVIYNEITVDTLIIRKIKFDQDTNKVYSDSLKFNPGF